MQKIFLCLVGMCLVWLAGLMAFVNDIPREKSTPPYVDAIVILTGGKGRMEAGLQYLFEKHGQMLFISGVGSGTKLRDLLGNLPPTLRENISTVSPSLIDLGHDAENTIGNAEETKEWITRNHIESIILVTSNYHMPRALLEFSKTIPQVKITPAPVFPEDFSLNNWWETPESRDLILSEYHKFLAAKLRHWVVHIL